MDSHRLDALLATTPENVYYLSDYAREAPFHTGRNHNAAILPRNSQQPATLFVEEFELPGLVQRPSWMSEIRVHSPGYVAFGDRNTGGPDEQGFRELLEAGRITGRPDRLELICTALRDTGLADATIGIDSASILAELQESTLLPKARFVFARDIFREIRVVKTPTEVAALRDTARIMETAVAGVINTTGRGTTCREVIRSFRINMATQGAYGSHITYGGGARPWVGFSDFSYQLKDGDILFIDPAGEYNHYWSDFGRTAFIGTPSEKFTDLYGALKLSHERAVPAMRVGGSFASVRDAARAKLDPSLAEGFLPLIHSIGLEQYDHPQTSRDFAGDDTKLESGMVINFETLYFELGWGVLQLEDTYMVTNGSPQKLTDMSTEPIYCS